MTMPRPIEQTLLAFFRQNTNLASDFDIDTDLLAGCGIDSLLVTDLLLRIEATFQIRLAARDVSPENLRTVRRLATLVSARQQKQRKAA